MVHITQGEIIFYLRVISNLNKLFIGTLACDTLTCVIQAQDLGPRPWTQYKFVSPPTVLKKSELFDDVLKTTSIYFLEAGRPEA